ELEERVRRDLAGEDSGAEDDHEADQSGHREAVAEEAHARVRPLAADLELKPGLLRALRALRLENRSDLIPRSALRQNSVPLHHLPGRVEGVVGRPEALSHNGSAGRGSRTGCPRSG